MEQGIELPTNQVSRDDKSKPEVSTFLWAFPIGSIYFGKERHLVVKRSNSMPDHLTGYVNRNLSTRDNKHTIRPIYRQVVKLTNARVKAVAFPPIAALDARLDE